MYYQAVSMYEGKTYRARTSVALSEYAVHYQYSIIIGLRTTYAIAFILIRQSTQIEVRIHSTVIVIGAIGPALIFIRTSRHQDTMSIFGKQHLCIGGHFRQHTTTIIGIPDIVGDKNACFTAALTR